MEDGAHDESRKTVAELLAGYARTLAELRRRGVVRSNNAPAGDYAEWLVARALVGTLADKNSEKLWDVKLATGEHVQVKTRVVSTPPNAGQLQTSPFRSWAFDSAAFVLLRAEDYYVVSAALVPVAVVKELGQWRQHVNGHVVMMNGRLLDHEDATDITEALNKAAVVMPPNDRQAELAVSALAGDRWPMEPLLLGLEVASRSKLLRTVDDLSKALEETEHMLCVKERAGHGSDSDTLKNWDVGLAWRESPWQQRAC